MKLTISYLKVLKGVSVKVSMRVIAGLYRHRLLKYPENNPNIRPTKDRIREAFFSALGDITGKTFLDLYAGSGAMGIEAISRGAKKSYFVDNNLEAIKYVKENIATLKIENAEVLIMDDMVALNHFHEKTTQFDIIFLDPPYESGRYLEVIEFIYKNNLLGKGGVLAFESKHKIPLNPLWYSKIKEYHYGEITVTVLR